MLTRYRTTRMNRHGFWHQKCRLIFFESCMCEDWVAFVLRRFKSSAFPALYTFESRISCWSQRLLARCALVSYLVFPTSISLPPCSLSRLSSRHRFRARRSKRQSQGELLIRHAVFWTLMPLKMLRPNNSAEWGLWGVRVGWKGMTGRGEDMGSDDLGKDVILSM